MVDRCRSLHCDCVGKSSMLFNQVYRRTQRVYESAQRESNAILRQYCVCLYRKVSAEDSPNDGIDGFTLHHHNQHSKSQKGTPVIPIISAPEA